MADLVNVVTGPPCSGKTTYATEHRSPDSVVIDLDALAHALGYPSPHLSWGDQHPAAEVARGLRYQLVGQVLKGTLAAEVWVIDSDPRDHMRRAYDRLGARVVDLDPGLLVCLARADDRPAETAEAIRRWYAARAEPTTVRTTDHQSDSVLDIFG